MRARTPGRQPTARRNIGVSAYRASGFRARIPYQPPPSPVTRSLRQNLPPALIPGGNGLFRTRRASARPPSPLSGCQPPAKKVGTAQHRTRPGHAGCQPRSQRARPDGSARSPQERAPHAPAVEKKGLPDRERRSGRQAATGTKVPPSDAAAASPPGERRFQRATQRPSGRQGNEGSTGQRSGRQAATGTKVPPSVAAAARRPANSRYETVLEPSARRQYTAAMAQHIPATLVDPFQRRISYLRLSVTDRCDFRCVYCMACARSASPAASR